MRSAFAGPRCIMPFPHRSQSRYNERSSRHDSRDRKAHHSGDSRQYRGRSRSRFEKHRFPPGSSVPRGCHESRPAPFEVCSTWKPSESHFDTTQEYGLSFLRVVEATTWSRQQQLANRPVEDIRAYEVRSGGSTNWSLRIFGAHFERTLRVIRSFPVKGGCHLVDICIKRD